MDLADHEARARGWHVEVLRWLATLPLAFDPTPPHGVILRDDDGEQVVLARTDRTDVLRIIVCLPADLDARAWRRDHEVSLRKTGRQGSLVRYELRATDLTAGVRATIQAALRCWSDRHAGDVALPTFQKAAGRGDLDTVRRGLRHAADPRALVDAAHGGRDAVVALLLDAGADPDASTPLSATIQDPSASLVRRPLHQAVGGLGTRPAVPPRRRSGHLAVARQLLEAGASVTLRAGRQDVTPPLAATMGGSEEAVALFDDDAPFARAALGLDTDEAIDDNGMSTLMYCAASRLPRGPALARVARELVDRGADVHVQRANHHAGEAPHHLNALSFAAYGNVDVLRVLLTTDISRDLGGHSFSAIGHAIVGRCEPALCLLYADAAGLHPDQHPGHTATHWLVEAAPQLEGGLGLARWMGDKKLVDTATTDAAGRTAIDLARSRGLDALAMTLALAS